MSSYTKKQHCRVCSGSNLKEILDLNEQPLANSYHKGEDLESYPLSLNLCEECYHLQLSVVVNPNLMFKNYLYVSGTSKTLNEYFESFVDICEKYNSKTKTVLDIACNDGTQLDKFKQKGWDTYGVDPAVNLHKLSSKKHNIVCDYWTPTIAKNMNRKYGVIVAQNVFAHVDDVHGFLESCSIVMDKDSRLFLQTSQADMVLNNEFDTIYHEHLSFFNTKSMKRCANINGFSLIDVFKTDVHGGSYVFVLAKGKHDESKAFNVLAKEERSGLYSLDTYDIYTKRCIDVASNLVKEAERFRANGYKIVGYGAAAKGNTFLNFSRLNLDYIVDDNEMKWGLLTPGMNITIRDPSCLVKEKSENLVIIPLAWNFFKEIKQKVVQITDSEVKYIKYFPKVQII